MDINLHVIPWYTSTEWEKVRTVSLDPDSMGLSFDDWLKAANEIANFGIARHRWHGIYLGRLRRKTLVSIPCQTADGVLEHPEPLLYLFDRYPLLPVRILPVLRLLIPYNHSCTGR